MWFSKGSGANAIASFAAKMFALGASVSMAIIQGTLMGASIGDCPRQGALEGFANAVFFAGLSAVLC